MIVEKGYVVCGLCPACHGQLITPTTSNVAIPPIHCNDCNTYSNIREFKTMVDHNTTDRMLLNESRLF